VSGRQTKSERRRRRGGKEEGEGGDVVESDSYGKRGKEKKRREKEGEEVEDEKNDVIERRHQSTCYCSSFLFLLKALWVLTFFGSFTSSGFSRCSVTFCSPSSPTSSFSSSFGFLYSEIPLLPSICTLSQDTHTYTRIHTPPPASTPPKNKPSLPPSLTPPPHANTLGDGRGKFPPPISIVPGREEDEDEAGREEGVLLLNPCLVKCRRISSRKEVELWIMLQPKRIFGPP